MTNGAGGGAGDSAQNGHEENQGDTENTVEIAFVLAGAVSAGAWIAGVMDHVLDAMQEFEDWRKDENDPDRPKHCVKISVLAGTSGGGMSAGLTAAQFAGVVPQGWRSILHHAWVESIDIEILLTLDDLEAKDRNGNPLKPRSLLNSKPLEAIRDEVLKLQSRSALPGYVADTLHVFVTFTNLRGIGYRASFQGGDHDMSLHADHAHFILGGGAAPATTTRLDPASIDPNNAQGGWKFLGETVLASGAFPAGLAPQEISRPCDHYKDREWLLPRERPAGNPPGCFDVLKLRPLEYPEDEKNFTFWTVDGGVMDNEPLDLARLQLAKPNLRNERDPSKARKVVVLVDPFPDPVDMKRRPAHILGALWATFGALISQARFKPDELMLATSDGVGSRFAITPSRRLDGDKPAKLPILSGIFDGFGGFLDRSIREHDYQLGRYNAEKFLKDWFRLAENNPVFGGWKGTDGHRPKPMTDPQGTSLETLPIVPCRNPAPGEEKEPDVPTKESLKKRLRELKGQINDRLKKVLKMTLGISGFRILWMLFIKNRVIPPLLKAIEDDIEEIDKPKDKYNWLFDATSGIQAFT